MAECNQCGKPAVVAVGGSPLCVACYYKLQQAMRLRDIMLKEEMNFLMAQAEAMTGLYGISPRYEMPAPVIQQGPMNFHNIKVDRSVVGAINTGEVQRIDVALSHISLLGNEELHGALSQFTEAVIASTAISPESKNEILEQIAAIASESLLPKAKRRPGVVKAILAAVSGAVSTIADLASLWGKLEPLLHKILSG